MLKRNGRGSNRSFAAPSFLRITQGPFPSTIVMHPGDADGNVYRNETGSPEVHPRHFEGGSLYKALRQGGYRVDSITEMRYDNQSATNFFRMPRPYVSYAEYTRFAAWQLADLSLFRHAPLRSGRDSQQRRMAPANPIGTR